MNDLRFAFRQFLKNPGFTAVAVLILALPVKQQRNQVLDWLALESSKLTLATCPASTRFQ